MLSMTSKPALLSVVAGEWTIKTEKSFMSTNNERVV